MLSRRALLRGAATLFAAPAIDMAISPWREDVLTIYPLHKGGKTYYGTLILNRDFLGRIEPIKLEFAA